MNKTLTLNLFKRWFEETRKGKKTIEFRSITPYWCSRLLLWEVKKGIYQRRNMKFWEAIEMNALNCGTNLRLTLRDLIKSKVVKFETYKEVRFLNGMKRLTPEFRIKIISIKLGKGKMPYCFPLSDNFLIRLDKKSIHSLLNCDHDAA